jgi:hypothetical protein
VCKPLRNPSVGVRHVWEIPTRMGTACRHLHGLVKAHGFTWPFHPVVYTDRVTHGVAHGVVHYTGKIRRCVLHGHIWVAIRSNGACREDAGPAHMHVLEWYPSLHSVMTDMQVLCPCV